MWPNKVGLFSYTVYLMKKTETISKRWWFYILKKLGSWTKSKRMVLNIQCLKLQVQSFAYHVIHICLNLLHLIKHTF
jgi:hypothetical protein